MVSTATLLGPAMSVNGSSVGVLDPAVNLNTEALRVVPYTVPALSTARLSTAFENGSTVGMDEPASSFSTRSLPLSLT